MCFGYELLAREIAKLPGGGGGVPIPCFWSNFPLFLISFQVVFLLGFKKVMKSLPGGEGAPVHAWSWACSKTPSPSPKILPYFMPFKSLINKPFSKAYQRYLPRRGPQYSGGPLAWIAAAFGLSSLNSLLFSLHSRTSRFCIPSWMKWSSAGISAEPGILRFVVSYSPLRGGTPIVHEMRSRRGHWPFLE